MIQQIQQYINCYGYCFIDDCCNVIHPNHARKVLNKDDGETSFYVVSPKFECRTVLDTDAITGAVIKRLYRIA